MSGLTRQSLFITLPTFIQLGIFLLDLDVGLVLSLTIFDPRLGHTVEYFTPFSSVSCLFQ